MGIAIGTHDEASGTMRYLRDDSTGTTLWSTSDPARAKSFGTFTQAERWVFALTDAMTDRLLSRRARLIDMESGEWRYIEDPFPPAWDDTFDSVSFAEVDECIAAAAREAGRQAKEKTK